MASEGGLLAYRPLPGVPDELVDPKGRIRPLWQGLAGYLDGLSPVERATHFARADQYLNDSGVFYRMYGAEGSVERRWPLSPVPVLVDEAEWQALEPALRQRADLLEAVMADLYGPNRLVTAGRLPAELIAANPEWLRPMVGIRPRTGHYLHFVAFELGRGPDGRWWVLADRAQAPSGAGYALENRVATSRALSEFYAEENVHRLAGFFRDFRDALLAHRVDRNGRAAILTPGPLNETYFEHSYIARYLAFNLVQGEDMSVQDGRLMLRTVSGPKPVEVLWRRMDSSFTDPLELNQSSRIGTPGLLAAIRAGQVSLINALGSGVVESRALMAFLPKLCQHLLGEPLLIPNVASWWCGDGAARQAVLAAADRMVLGPAFSTALPFDADAGRRMAAAMPPAELQARLETEGAGLVAEESVTLSTTPALIDGAIVPRPMTLRVFLARSQSGWAVMPGGFARIGATADPAALALQRGGKTADVWIVSDHKVEPLSMVPARPEAYRRPLPSALPSRAADNLFWLGRYVERAEGIIRLLRARNTRLAESGAAQAPLFDCIAPLLSAQGVDPEEGIPKGLRDTLAAAITSAGQVRDRFSPDAWTALADLQKTATRMAARVTPGDDAARALSALLRKLAGISGLVNENMYRFVGWRFLTIGRQHERAMSMAHWLSILADDDAPSGALELAVEVGDSVLTHRRRFSVYTSRQTVIDLLALDPMNPRSLRHQIDGMRAQIDLLPDARDHGTLSPVARDILRLQTDLAVSDAEAMTTEVLEDFRDRIADLSDLLTRAYLT
ncbi:circularly permuted type 2 ATP-grasp protein [Neotabrizicola sp. sgz301269]|uniref:circularly permuted type 2 ATP-grasp protein n=1 Tax=Neotabrizicola sp. sgz301269 TaxID=3276282 RepID=UPI00376FC377